ncbi:MAG TPA: type II toxin-antitoxin system HicB family antitoxin [Rhizomicrobium sp.]
MSRYTALVDGKAGAYGIVFPELDGCVAMGATVDEALANAAEALRDWVEVTHEHGEPVPPPQPVEKVRRRRDVVEALADGSILASVPLVRETGKPAKANLSIDSGILAAIDEEASRRKLTRSAFIELLARESLPKVA